LDADAFHIGNGHLLLDGLGHFGEANAELSLNQFADAANAAIAEMVDVVGVAKAIDHIHKV
jgi:hypothetical protein